MQQKMSKLKRFTLSYGAGAFALMIFMLIFEMYCFNDFISSLFFATLLSYCVALIVEANIEVRQVGKLIKKK